MRYVIAVGLLALASAVSIARGVDPQMQEKIKAAKERYEAMSPKEQAEYRWLRTMKRFGGWVTKSGSGSGSVSFVNTTKKVSTDFVRTAISEIEDLLDCKMVAQTSEIHVTVQNADKELLRTHSEAAVFLVEDASLPTLLVAPESDWAIVNVSALAAGDVEEKVFLFRVEKELWRAFGHLCGAADSAMGGCVLSPVNSLEDLDNLTGKYICPEPMQSLKNHLNHIGVRPYRRVTYLDACKEGWAHQPTNDYQKAIWIRVHEAPAKPIVIAPETKKQ